MEHLRKIVQAHTKAGIKINPEKTKIFQSEVEYLGHKVSQDGGLYQECAELATPTRCKEMSSFLDLQDIIGESFPGNHGMLH